MAGFPPRPFPRVIFDGQSLNIEPANGDNFPKYLMSGIGAYFNVGVSGFSWTALAPSFASRCRPIVQGCTKVIVFMTGANFDIYDENDPAAVAMADTELIAALYQNAGAAYIVESTIPVATVYSSGENTERTAYNSALLASVPGSPFWDSVCDIAADPSLDDFNDATYYQADKTHWTAAGAQAAATAFGSHLTAALAFVNNPARDRVYANRTVFDYTGSAQTWNVPATKTYHITLRGASGGTNIPAADARAIGGFGNELVFDRQFTSGASIQVNVGGRGTDTVPTNISGQAGGWNGGGAGGDGSGGNDGGAGGGGATDLREGGTALGNRCAVAAGGGGAAGGDTSTRGGGQGPRGRGQGTNGGAAGTSGAGGAVGSGGGSNGTAGSSGTGGRAKDGQAITAPRSGGGGGGGYYGGGGGGNGAASEGGGGGAGSEYTDGSCSSIRSRSGWSGHGQVVIEWD